MTRRPSAFTLVELLTVIGILLLLMGLALPATKAISLSMQKAQASTDTARIQNALSAYYNEYGRFPVSKDWKGLPQGKNPTDGGFCGEYATPANPNDSSQQTWLFAPQVSILIGMPWVKDDALCTSAVKAYNPKGISFLTVREKDKQMCYNNQDTGATPEWGFGDPFVVKRKTGNTAKTLRLPYKAKVDENGNNEIEHYDRFYRKRALVWSLGPDGIEAELDRNPKTNDDIGDFAPLARRL